jgi:chromosome segregation ATPase
MNDSNNIDRTLGKLEATLETLVDQNKILNKKLDAISDSHAGYDIRIRFTQEKLEEIEGKVNDHEKFKTRVLTVVMVISGGIGFVSHVLSKWLSKIAGGF